MVDTKTWIIAAILIVGAIFLNSKFNFLGSVFTSNIQGTANVDIAPSDGSSQFKENGDISISGGDSEGQMWVMLLDGALYKYQSTGNTERYNHPWYTNQLCDEYYRFYLFPENGLQSLPQSPYIGKGLPGGTHEIEIVVVREGGVKTFCRGSSGAGCQGCSGCIDQTPLYPFCPWYTSAEQMRWVGPEYLQLYQKIIPITVHSNPCILNGGETLVLETYESGSVIDPNNFLYKPSVAVSRKFCYVHPPIVLDQETKTTYVADWMITRFESGATYSVPEGKSVAVFYVTDSALIPKICNATTQAYDPVEGKCLDTVAMAFVCREGVLDPVTGTCVLSGSVECDIANGFHYDLVKKMCIKTINCENAGDCDLTCPEGYLLEERYGNATGYSTMAGKQYLCVGYPANENVCIQPAFYEDGKCVVKPEVVYNCISGNLTATKECVENINKVTTCETGFTLNEATGKCEKPGDNIYTCSADYSWDNTLTKCVKGGDIKSPILERLTGVFENYAILFIIGAIAIVYIIWGRKK